MRRLFQIVPVAAITLTAGAFLSDTCVLAQEHLIGEQPSASRVIQLRSSGVPTPAARPQTTDATSRSVRTAQHEVLAPTKPTATQFDANRPKTVVPDVLKSTHVPPRVAEQPVEKMKPKAPLQAAEVPAIPNWNIAPVAGKSVGYPVASPTKSVSVSKSAPAINTQIEAPGYINLNQTATLRIKLQNVSGTSAPSVKLVATLPAHAKFVRATPNPTRSEGRVFEFQLNNMSAQQIREIAIDLIPTEKTPLDIGTEVIVENTQRIAVGVRQPKIKMSLQGPTEANMGQTVNHKVVLENTGDGLAEKIQLLAKFPNELHCSKKYDVTIPTLEPGQSIVVDMSSLAAAAGSSELSVNVSAVGVDAQSAKAPIRIFQPELEVSARGPEMNFVNREGTYTIKLDNTGSVDASDVKIQLAVPRGMQVTTISREANVDPENGMLIWTFDRIPAKTEQTIMLKTTAIEPGQQVCHITVRSKETKDKEIQLATIVATRADLNVIVDNKSGPVQVGGKTQFVVVIENRGSSSATDVAVNIELPESLSPEKDSSSAFGLGNTISFQDAKIEPGQKREFLFTAIANKKGEHVVRSVLKTGGSERQIITEGSVYVYEVSEARISEALSPAILR